MGFLKNKWNLLRARFRQFVDNLKWWSLRCRNIYHYMKGQVIKNLPAWRKEAHDYSEVWHERYDEKRSALRRTQQAFKTVFSRLDASPEKLHELLFEEKTLAGRMFDWLLIVLILASVFIVILDSVDSLHRQFFWLFGILEWMFTIVFTVEYLLRIYSSPRPIRYMTSFYGIIDLITVLPTYIGVIFSGAHAFLVLRVLRVLRIFRLLKLVKMMRAGSTIMLSLKASREKIVVFLIFVLLLVTIMGSMMYIIEAGTDSGFTSIPVSIYWAIVTLTTVGYGDIAPGTWLGQFIAALVMIMGYAVIAVPTGIVSAEFIEQRKIAALDRTPCDRCGKNEHEQNARYCSRCGERLLTGTT